MKVFTALENNQNTQKEGFNMNLTALEEKTMIEIGSEDGNGEYIRNSGFHEQYMSILWFTTPMQQLRGVFASLVKKGLIEIIEDEYDNLIKVTDLGLKYLETKGL
jgi:hypothetical protein